jgi:ankyrin repeat protein
MVYLQFDNLTDAEVKYAIDSIRQTFHDAGPAESLKIVNTTVEGRGEMTTLLMGAASGTNCSVETMQLLLENGANPNEINDLGGHSLAAVCVVGTREKAKMLLEYGANVELKLTNGTNNSCLHIAVFNHQVDIACTLLDFGANVNSVNVYNITALNYAYIKLSLPFVKKLLEHGADCNLAGTDGTNPIMNATRSNDIHALESLLQQESINVNYLLGGNVSPLIYACVYGQAEIVAMLLRSEKCDVTLKASTLQTAWSATFSTAISSQRDQSDIARLLLATGKIDINASDDSTAAEDTALHYSALYNKIEQVTLLLAHQDIDTERTRKNNRSTALVLAMSKHVGPWDKNRQIRLAIINKLVMRKRKCDYPDWVNPLKDPWYDRDPSTWQPDEGRK